jgi:predicted nuclease of predicted toxin-antitoxin system
MKLLFDQNLSFKLCKALADLYPGSNQIRLLGLEQADDRSVWEYARANGFTVISLDADFAEMASLLGPTPNIRSSGYAAATSRPLLLSISCACMRTP